LKSAIRDKGYGVSVFSTFLQSELGF